jgi:N-acetyl-gamma-glutamyl-phosphate reductase
VSGAGRGGGQSGFGYAETNEDVLAYGLAGHPHGPEMREALGRIAGARITLAFTPHLVPMTRGILATCYARPRGTTSPAALEEAARATYRDEPFVRVVPVQGGRSPRTKWATGANLVFVAYTMNEETGLVVALAAIDNLGKGAAGQAVQNANLMTGQPETAGLTGLPLWP